MDQSASTARPTNERILIGTAGWSIPRASATHFPAEGSHLARYSQGLRAVEINSSFYRPHSVATYARWAAATPPGFRFAIKLPRTITHELELRRSRPLLERFLSETDGLGDKRGPILVQLPPSHVFDARVVGRFFDLFRARFSGSLVCEPRHATWLTSAADRLLAGYEVARVAADPARAPGADVPGGWNGLVYYRLHGSPRTYWSRYSAEYLDGLSRCLQTAAKTVDSWCVFDNTAAGAAIENAWELQSRLVGSRHRDRRDPRARPRWMTQEPTSGKGASAGPEMTSPFGLNREP